MDFDAIVVGSGATGGWAAKELCEKGLKTLVIERGRPFEHRDDYTTEGLGKHQLPFRGEWPPDRKSEYSLAPTARPENYWLYATDEEIPYVYDPDKPFLWIRPNVVGGRSLTWGRHSYRWSRQDFEANSIDGHGIDWPVRYDDIAPWYSYVEDTVGISGEALGLSQLPDSKFQPPMPLNIVEQKMRDVLKREFEERVLTIGRVANLTEQIPEQGRAPCQYRNACHRGCSFGAYFSTQSVTLPMAKATGNLTLRSNQVVESLEYDADGVRVTGVRVVDAISGKRAVYRSRIVFLCASCVASNQVLLNSRSPAMPNGLGNNHDILGRYIMDHIHGIRAFGTLGRQFDKYVEYGRRPTGFYIPRYRNLPDQAPQDTFIRGYGFQGAARRTAPEWSGGFGIDLKNSLRKPGPWEIYLIGFGEVLPYRENRVFLAEKVADRYGIPQVEFDVAWGENESNMSADMVEQQVRMLEAVGATDIQSDSVPSPPGRGIHEIGGARMGADPRNSVVNAWNQMHVAPNVFVTDGAFMSSGSCVNTTLTLMAFTARAANHAVDRIREGSL